MCVAYIYNDVNVLSLKKKHSVALKISDRYYQEGARVALQCNNNV